MGLSLNPCSWSISNIAETLVEKLTGSEALGDIAGLAGAYMTGDVKGLASQSLDLADNVAKGAKKFADGIWGAAKDAVKEFSNPGAVKQPTVPKCPGYSPTKTPPKANDTGTVGNFGDAAFSQSLEQILNNPSMSLEAKIFAILMKLQSEERKKMLGKVGEMTKLKGADQAKSLASMDKESPEYAEAKAKQDSAMYSAQFELQDAQNKVGELSQMLTNLMKSFHDTKMATIGNLR